MKLGVLFSGGKDSTYALAKAMENNEVSCLISIISKNDESYMFHVPNIKITKLQSEAIGLPLIEAETEGKKEKELKDLKKAIEQAKKQFNIEGIVTGAIESVYQSKRIKKICDDMGLKCVNPLWKMNQEKLLRELVENRFKVIISGVFVYPFHEEWLGKEIDNDMIEKLLKMREDYHISPTGEGGEIETTVLDAPFFKKRVEIVSSETITEEDSGTFVIKEAKLVNK